MRKIPFKNYFILVLLLMFVFFFTLALANMYTNKIQVKTDFFEAFKRIDVNDFNQYIIENPDAIIYISSVYDEANKQFEKDFRKVLNKNNLHDFVVCIDKSTLNKESEEQINLILNTNIDFSHQPIILVLDEKQIKNIVYVNPKIYDENTIIDYGVFK